MPNRTRRSSAAKPTRDAVAAREARARRHAAAVDEVVSRDGRRYTSTRVGDLRAAERRERMQQTNKRRFVRLGIILAVVAALIIGWFALYNSNAFAIEDVNVQGVEHLTSEEMAQLAAVPSDSTLLRVDTDAIRERLLQNAWVLDAQVKRKFPHTLEIVVTERDVLAIVEVQSATGAAVKSWAIAPDYVWLMPIPDPSSDAAKTTNPQIYEDAQQVLHITDVPYGTIAEIGSECVDSNVLNALDILSGLTTELADMVVSVSAANPAETTLLLNNGVEVAFGEAENIRDKERVVLKIMADNPDGVVYINVRIVDQPTWRSI